MEPLGHSSITFLSASLRGSRKTLAQDGDDGLKDKHTVPIHNARAMLPQPTLDKEGFQLFPSPWNERDPWSKENIKKDYYRQCVELIQSTTGCSSVLIYGHLCRDGGSFTEGRGGAYADAAHADITPYAEQLLESHIPMLHGRHWALYNIWRSTDMEGDIEMMPLAICDRRSVSPCDMIINESFQGMPDLPPVAVMGLLHSSSQRWFIYPRMSPREAIVFKQYDTQEFSMPLRQVFHTSIVDPNTPAAPRQRRSIEVRVIAVFDNEDSTNARRLTFETEFPPPSVEFSTATAAPGQKRSKL